MPVGSVALELAAGPAGLGAYWAGDREIEERRRLAVMTIFMAMSGG
jgi:hypothetical protein